jgi:predicted transcriptional regulator
MIDEADLAELDRLSRETDRSRAHIVREAISQYLSKTRSSAAEAI